MKKVILVGLIFLLVILGGAGTALFFYSKKLKALPASEAELPKDYAYTQEDIVNLTKPAVVRIVQHTKGKAQLPNFRIEFTKGLESMKFVPDPKGKKKEFSFDDYLYGSGFIISEDGYILTNSHVASYQTSKLLLAEKFFEEVVKRDMMLAFLQGKITLKDLEKIAGENGDRDLKFEENLEEISQDVAKQMTDYISVQGTYEIDKKIYVLSPNSKKEKLSELIEEALLAKTVSVNDNFWKDDKDVALIKIDKANLPTVALNTDYTPTTGEKISIFGFPASAEFNDKNPLESTFTTGSVSAFKDSEEKNFQLIQTDAKVSSGSSGGPLFNQKGEVIGITTFQSALEDRKGGDNFAFAIPAKSIKEWVDNFKLGDNQLPQNWGMGYQEHIKNGLALSEISRCQKANEKFRSTEEKTQPLWEKSFVASYVAKCDEKIQKGESIDTMFQEKTLSLKKVKKTTWLIIGGTVAFIILVLIVVLILAVKLSKKKESAPMENNNFQPGNFYSRVSESPTPTTNPFSQNPQIPQAPISPTPPTMPSTPNPPARPNPMPERKNHNQDGNIQFFK